MRSVVYDQNLGIQAYRLQGYPRPFPCHFHDYYVFGLVEQGQRRLLCNGSEYEVASGDVLVFNPRDSHACSREGRELLDYCAITVTESVMRSLVESCANPATLPYFEGPVIRDVHLAECLHCLVESTLSASSGLEKEELFLLFMEALWGNHIGNQGAGDEAPEALVSCPMADAGSAVVSCLCDFIDLHYAEHLTLDRLIEYACCGEDADKNERFSKSTLLRLFLRQKGITPYKYLESVRIQKAAELLQRGVMPAEVACLVGCSDQSHLNRCFKRLMGLTPKAYQNAFF